MMAFMFETSYMLRLTDYAIASQLQDPDYMKCWEGFPSTFLEHK